MERKKNDYLQEHPILTSQNYGPTGQLTNYNPTTPITPLPPPCTANGSCPPSMLPGGASRPPCPSHPAPAALKQPHPARRPSSCFYAGAARSPQRPMRIAHKPGGPRLALRALVRSRRRLLQHCPRRALAPLGGPPAALSLLCHMSREPHPGGRPTAISYTIVIHGLFTLLDKDRSPPRGGRDQSAEEGSG